MLRSAQPSQNIDIPDLAVLCILHRVRGIVVSGLGVSGLVAFTTLTRSLQLISPNLVASLRCLELVLAFLLQTVGAPTKHTRGLFVLILNEDGSKRINPCIRKWANLSHALFSCTCT